MASVSETAPASLNPKVFKVIASILTATGISPPDDANRCIVQCVTQNCRWRADGTNPTAAIGMIFEKDTERAFHGKALMAAIKFIEETPTGTLNVHFFSD